MYESLKGKKLLVLGSAEIDANIVAAAHELGVYVAVADGVKKSPATFAKNIADESWDVDYSKTEEVGEMCKARGIDGVFAGYSEFRVSAACKIAKYIGSPFYATEEQIELTRNKRRFKDECIKYGVRVPMDHPAVTEGKGLDDSGIVYPVIVKPTDAAGRKGVTICYDRAQLALALELAYKYSVSKTVVVEDYVVGTEFVAIYTIKDGAYSLSCFNEKYLNKEAPSSGLCDLALTPSKYLKGYVEKTDPCVKRFLKGIGAVNGVAFFQGIATEDDFVIFEMGFRLNGGNDYFIAEKENGISYMKMLIAHSLTGTMEGDLERDDPVFSKYYANFLLYSHAGTVGESAFMGTTDHKGIEDIHIKKAPGMKVLEDGTTQQCAFTFKLSAENLKELAKLTEYCQNNAVLTDENGRNMLFRPFDPSALFE